MLAQPQSTSSVAMPLVSPLEDSALTEAPSERQIAANRANAQRSTGPRTPEGKRASRANALKHGLFCRVLELNTAVLEDEREELDALLDDLNARYRPDGAMEEAIVDRIVSIWWRLARLSSHSQRHLAARLAGGASEFDAILESEAMGPAEGRLSSSLSRLHRHLAFLQRDRHNETRRQRREAVESLNERLLAEQAELEDYVRARREAQREARRAEAEARQVVQAAEAEVGEADLEDVQDDETLRSEGEPESTNASVPATALGERHGPIVRSAA